MKPIIVYCIFDEDGENQLDCIDLLKKEAIAQAIWNHGEPRIGGRFESWKSMVKRGFSVKKMKLIPTQP